MIEDGQWWPKVMMYFRNKRWKATKSVKPTRRVYADEHELQKMEAANRPSNDRLRAFL